MSLASVERLVEELRNGRPVILVDDEERENEGDIVLPAVHATPGWINFMIREGRGLLCVAMAPERANELGLSPMVERNTDPHSTMFTVSVDHVSNGTGISAFDRCATVRALGEPGAGAGQFRRPGHIFPLIARKGGILERPGHTEASVELARLAGLPPVAAICEVMADDGRMARLEQLRTFAHEHGLLVGSIADLVRFSSDTHTRPVPEKPIVEAVAESRLPTRFGDFRMIGFEDRVTGAEHLALVMGEVEGEPLLVRMHSECLTGDALHSLRCDCGSQLDASLAAIGRERRGALVYLRQEGRGIGLLNKIRAYALQDAGADTVEANERLGFPADARDFRAGAEILTALGIDRLRLLTNNPRKVEDLVAHGLDVVERLPLEVGRNGHNDRYLATKAEKLDHQLSNTAYHQGNGRIDGAAREEAAHARSAHEEATSAGPVHQESPREGSAREEATRDRVAHERPTHEEAL